MRALSGILIIIAVLFAGNWWYGSLGLTCRLPVAYSIGTFDQRFGISETDARAALTEAEAVWERAIGRDDLFVYQDDASLKVNFIYDERQRQAEAAEQAKDDLETRDEANEVLVELHRQLVEEYRSYETTYETKRSSYETELAAYNAEVERHNQNGGAPPEVYAELESRRVSLDAQRDEINELGEKLNSLSDQINEIGEKGNNLIGEYNKRVRQFNDAYVSDEEYTQGDYRQRQINVYTFNSHRELALVLAHEFGHALAIEHVENPASVMYYLMGGQKDPPSLTEEDKAAFRSACESGTVMQLLSPFLVLYNSLIKQ